MKRILLCLSIGLVAVGCQNGTMIPEHEVRENFSSYCKLTGGTPDGSNVCICGNYRCYERACNHSGDRCDDRLCYTGDTKCTNGDNKIGTIQICENREFIEIDINKRNIIKIQMEPVDNSNNEVYLNDRNQCTITQDGENEKNVSCGKKNHSWEATCGICLDGVTCKEGASSDFNATVSLCESGIIAKTITCGSDKCQENHCEKCDKSTFKEYCENSNNIGHVYSCDENNNIIIKEYCTNASCNEDLTGCGECLNEEPQCKKLNDTNYYFYNKCINGQVPDHITTQDIINNSDFKLYANPGCNDEDWITCPVCIKINDNETPIFYTCKEDKCTIASCAEKCDLKHGCGEGNLEYDYTECHAGDINSCACEKNEDCTTECDKCKDTDCICQNNKCETLVKCKEPSNDCPGMSRCANNGACITNCDSNNQCKADECEVLKCPIGDREANVYCPTDPESEFKPPFPFILYKDEDSELHIDSDNFFLLRNISDIECIKNISTIVLHGVPNENYSFKIPCEDLNNNGSITLPPNITQIIGYKDSPIIQCKEGDTPNYSLKAPLFKALNSITLENFGINIDFDYSDSEEQGGLANTITDSTLNNIQIAGEITCSSDNCGLLAGTMTYNDPIKEHKLDIKGRKQSETTISITAESTKDNIGGLIGKLDIKSEIDISEIEEPPFKFSDIEIDHITGNNTTGGIIGILNLLSPKIKYTNKDKFEPKLFEFKNINTKSISGENNIGGIIGKIDNKESNGLISIDFSNTLIGDNKNTDDAIVISGTNNVGGFIGSIGCKDDVFCDNANPNIIISGIDNALFGTVSGHFNVGGVIGAATGISKIHKFALNAKKDSEKDSSHIRGHVIGGDLRNKAYNSEHIGGLIGKLVLLNKYTMIIENVTIKLDKIECAEYEDRLKECTPDNTCPTKGLCTQIIQCSTGGGVIGWLDIANDSNFNLNKLHLHTNTLAISRISGGLVGNIGNKNNEYLGDQYSDIEHTFGTFTISDVLIVIPKVDGRLDLFGKFRGIANNIRLLKKLSLSRLFAVIKLNDKIDLNYCLYKDEYEQPAQPKEDRPYVDRRPCQLPSSKTDNAICKSDASYNLYDDKLTCYECLSEYIRHYPYFLIYAPECRYTDGMAEQMQANAGYCYIDGIYDFTEGNTLKKDERDLSPNLNLTKIKDQSVYFYQFADYSTYHRPHFKDEDDNNKIKMHYEVMYGQCFTNNDATTNNTTCTYLQNDCSIKDDGNANTLNAGINLYCCNSSNGNGGQCTTDKQNNNNKYVCVDEKGTPHNNSTIACTKIDDLKVKHNTPPDTFFKDWQFDPLASLPNNPEIEFPIPIIDLN